MIQHTIQTSGALDRINDALLGKTSDDLALLTKDLELLLIKAKEIMNVTSSVNHGGADYSEQFHCNL
jgi:hypothetical protein